MRWSSARIVVGGEDDPAQARDAVRVLGSGSGGPPDNAAQVPLGPAQVARDGVVPDVGRADPAGVVGR